MVLTSDQGLSYLAKSFYDHGLIQKVLIRQHSSRTNHDDWYARSSVVSSLEELLECETLLFFETPFYEELFHRAKEKGIKTVIMPMYECTHPRHVALADMVIVPSLLDQVFYPDSIFIPVPVEVKWQKRLQARHFVHNAGNGGLGGRNGTKELLEAIQHVKSPIQLTIRSQVPIQRVFGGDSRVSIQEGQVSSEELWKEGDVFIFPEKFNGLSLPLQEAYAAGMLVMAGNRFPMNTWLPTEPLIPIKRSHMVSHAVQFQSAQYDPREIAAKIDEWYNRDIWNYSERGRKWGQANSWPVLKEQYEAILSQ